MSHKSPTKYYETAKHIALSIPYPEIQVEVIENALLEVEMGIEAKCPRACARHFSDLKLNLARLDGYECDFCRVEEEVLSRFEEQHCEPDAKSITETPVGTDPPKSEVS